MQSFRHLLAKRILAVLICSAALVLKLVVPVGYMVSSEHGRVAITQCPGAGSAPMTMAMPGKSGAMTDHGKTRDHGKAELPCAFAGLSGAMLAAVDLVLLAGLIAFVMALETDGVSLSGLAAGAYLRPPLRGPPTHL